MVIGLVMAYIFDYGKGNARVYSTVSLSKPYNMSSHMLFNALTKRTLAIKIPIVLCERA